MSKSILVGYDPREHDRAPVQFAVTVAHITSAPLVVACAEAGPGVIPISAGQSLPYAVTQTDADLVSDCRETIDEIESELEGEGISFASRRLRSTSAARALHELAEDEDAGLLVVGSSRRAGAERVLLGSTAERLIHGAPCPVALVPRSWTREHGIRTVGVAYVDSQEGREALRGAYALARRAGARLRVVTIVKETVTMALHAEAPAEGRFGKSTEDVEGEYMLQAERHAKTEVATLGRDVPVEVEVFLGDPASKLVELSQHLDLLVCGSRGYGPVRAVLLGSVSRHVATEAHCPVIVLPRGVEASLEALLAEAPQMA
jgi:nucleotide-binding universal stress UspA family protein